MYQRFKYTVLVMLIFVISACGASAPEAPASAPDTSAVIVENVPTDAPVAEIPMTPTAFPVNTDTPRFAGMKVIASIWDVPTSDGHITIHGIKVHLTIIDTATGSIAGQEYLKVILNGQNPPYLYDGYASGELYLDFPPGVGLESLEVQFLNKCNMLIDKDQSNQTIVPNSDGETNEYVCSY